VTESIDLAAHQVGNARLRHVQQPSRRSLRELTRINDPRELDHEIRTNAQMLRFRRGEADPLRMHSGIWELSHVSLRYVSDRRSSRKRRRATSML